MAIGPVVEIGLAEIEVGGFEVRVLEDDAELVALADSIRADGLIEALIVRATGEGYELVAGHRRLAACRLAGFERVSCRVLSGDEGSCERVSIAENEFRRDVSPVERAWQIRRAYESGAMGLEDLGRAYGRRVEWVEGQLAILSWPERVQRAVHEGKMGVGVGRQLARVEDEGYREVLITAALESGCTERTAAGWVAGYKAMEPAVEVAERVAVSDGSGGAVVMPMVVCPGCLESFRPDAMVAVGLCMGCRGTLEGGG